MGQLLRLAVGVELAADVGEMLGALEVEVDVEGEVEYRQWGECSCSVNPLSGTVSPIIGTTKRVIV